MIFRTVLTSYLFNVFIFFKQGDLSPKWKSLAMPLTLSFPEIAFYVILKMFIYVHIHIYVCIYLRVFYVLLSFNPIVFKIYQYLVTKHSCTLPPGIAEK